MKHHLTALLLILSSPGLYAQAPAAAPGTPAPKPAPAAKPAPQGPVPTLGGVSYGNDPRQILDFWKADTKEPAPVLFFIHGGGWHSGDKAKPDFLAQCQQHSISLVSINYRLLSDATAEKISPPVKACLDDAARALQFVRSKAAEWRIDPNRIGGCPSSSTICRATNKIN